MIKPCKLKNIKMIYFLFIVCSLIACSFEKQVDLCDYHNIKIPYDVVEVSDEDLKIAIRMKLLEQNASIPKVANQNIVEENDVVTFVISKKDSPNEEVTVVVGYEEFADGFDELLLGKNIGHTYSVTFQEEKYSFKILKTERLAEELTDDLAVRFFNTSKADTVIAEIKKQIAEHRAVDYAYENLINNSRIRTNNSKSKDYAEKKILKLSKEASNAGQTSEEYAQNCYDMTLEQYREININFYDEFIILKAFIEEEGETVSKYEFEKYISELAVSSNTDSNTITELYDEEYIYYQMYYEKSRDLLLKYITY